MLAASLALLGDEANARAVAQELLAIEPSFRVSTFVSGTRYSGRMIWPA
jgi:adenylate cyclase